MKSFWEVSETLFEKRVSERAAGQNTEIFHIYKNDLNGFLAACGGMGDLYEI